MGKVARIKGDLDDVEALLEIITVLKDVSTNRFFAFAQRKANFAKFLEIFLTFFDMLEAVDTQCPLVRNSHPGVDILIVTSEQGFMSQLNSRVCYAGFQEWQKYPQGNIVCVGWRGAERCKQLGMNVAKVFTMAESPDRYEMSLKVRDYVIERMLGGKTGRVIVVYVWAKSFNVLKPKVITLLPAVELLGSDSELTEQEKKILRKQKEFIEESSIDDSMKALADIWVSSRIYEIVSDERLAEAAAQAQQLEQAIEGLTGERNGLKMAFRKAGRDDLNKAMREVFSQASLARRR